MQNAFADRSDRGSRDIEYNQASEVRVGRPARAQSPLQNAGLGDIQRFIVGDSEVIAWWDGYAQMPTSMLVGFDPTLAETAAQNAYKPYDSDSFDVGINGYVNKTANRVNAVATGAPLAMAPTVGRWHASLAMAGLTPDDVETVFLTHMHGDHVGGLADVKAQTPNPYCPMQLPVIRLC